MRYQCLDCGAISTRPRCPAHRATGGHWSAGRDRATQAKFRAAVLARAGYRCEHVTPAGTRCTVTGASNLIAHHRAGLAAGGTSTAANGAALCGFHHRAVDARAR